MLKLKFFPHVPCVSTNREQHLQLAGSELEKIVAQSLRQAPPAQAPLMAWPVVCGSAVAERTQALNFGDGVLRVEVPDMGWRSELQILAPRYLAAINRYTVGVVRRIEFVVSPQVPVAKDGF
jgi:predicted nucleic acid-binding Zn ribbon protein